MANFTLTDFDDVFPAGDDVSGEDVINGRAGEDALSGGDSRDTLKGQNGDDELFGEGGDDVLEGGAGADAMDGGADFDVASYKRSGAGVTLNLADPGASLGDALGDTFVSIERFKLSDHDDVFIGGTAAVDVDGNDGDDHITGGAQGDLLRGGLGGDDISGGEGGDDLRGDDGDDALAGGDGDDVLEGGAGADALDGGDGLDIASYALAGSAVTIDRLDPGGSDGDAFGDTYVSIERFVLSIYDDVFIGDDDGAYVLGGWGYDALTGGAGIDRLFGGADNDVLIGGGGNDRLRGEDGDDLLDGGEGRDRFYGGDGLDTVSYQGEVAGVIVDLDGVSGLRGTDALFDSIEAFDLSNFEDVFHGSGDDDDVLGFAGADILFGHDGWDVLAGGEGDDQIDGGEGDDILAGEDGDDLLDGADGEDMMIGGEGTNTLNGGSGFDFFDASQGVNIMDGGPLETCGCGDTSGGALVVYTFAAGGVSIDLQTGVTGGEAAGDTFVNIRDFSLSLFGDTFVGTDESDWVEGDEGADTLSGGDGDDLLSGGFDLDVDVLDGGAGDDLIYADENDVVTTGSGEDMILFAHFDGTVTVADYELGVDIFDLAYGWSSYSITGDTVTFDDEVSIAFTGYDDLGVQAIMVAYEAWLLT